MTTKRFVPNISSENIQEALDESKNFELPEHIQAEISKTRRRWLFNAIGGIGAGMIVGLVIFVIGLTTYPKGIFIVSGNMLLFSGASMALFSVIYGLVRILRHNVIPASRATPVKVARNFYSDLLDDHDYGRAYQMLAPPVMKRDACNSVSNFTKTWVNTYETIEAMTLEQESVSCSSCPNTGVGVWTNGGWQVSDEKLKSINAFLHCDVCGTVYCVDCFIKLDRERRCSNPECNKPLKGRYLYHKIFLNEIEPLDPIFQISSVDVIEEEGDNVAHIASQVKCSSKYLNPLVAIEDNGWERINRLTCQFHNTAVKIGSEWYLLSGEPGAMLED